MTKAKTYKLLSCTLRIEYRDAVTNDDGEWIFGETASFGNKTVIAISTKDKDGHPFTKAELEVTLRHELFHFILDTLYFTELSRNETLVEWLANATLELNKQGLTI